MRVRVTHRDLTVDAAVAQRRREWRAQQRRRRHAEQDTPMPTAAWVAFGVFCLVALLTGNFAAVPGLALIGLGVWVYAQRRAVRVAANLARRQPRVGPTGFEGMAATYDRHGMPESAKAYRDLADEQRGRHSA